MPSSCLSLLSSWSTACTLRPHFPVSLKPPPDKSQCRISHCTNKKPKLLSSKKGDIPKYFLFHWKYQQLPLTGYKKKNRVFLFIGFWAFCFYVPGMDPGPHPCRASALPLSYITSCETVNNFSPAPGTARYAFLYYLKRRRVGVHRVYMTTMNYTFKRY